MEEQIALLKSSKNAVILAHNYQNPEVQDIADFVGDSLELSVKAKETAAEIIVFCGVDFMAETAKILSPEKMVLLPVKDASCPLAAQLSPGMIADARKRHPDAAVVLYINSTAACKAYADSVCTSANAVAVVNSFEEETILFGPDANLAYFVQCQVPGKRIIPLPETGHCYVHTGFTREDVAKARRIGGTLVCHPECPPGIQREADLVASTGGMVRNAPSSDVWQVFTERDMVYRLKTLYPEKIFYSKEEAICEDMKKITLHDVVLSLEREQYQITLPGDIIARARGAIERMISIRG